MKGLLLKDLITIKRRGGVLMMFFALLTVIDLFTDDLGMTSSFCVIPLLLVMGTLVEDMRTGWGAYAQCLPYTRGQVVRAKYLLGLLMAVVSFLLSLGLGALYSFGSAVTWADRIMHIVTMLTLMLIFCAVGMPFLYWRNDAGCLAVILGGIACIAIGIGLMFLVLGIVGQGAGIYYVNILMVLTAGVLYLISYFASVKIYEARPL